MPSCTRPARLIQFNQIADFSINKLKERGKPVERAFEYHSGKNPHFLKLEEIIEFNGLAGY